MASEKKALISTISRANEPVQVGLGSSKGKAGGGGTVFFSLKDLHSSLSTNEQLPKVKEILRGKIGQILGVMDQIESKDSAKNVLSCSSRYLHRTSIAYNILCSSAHVFCLDTGQCCYFSSIA